MLITALLSSLFIGCTNPVPYKPQTPVVKYQQTASTQYVRVYKSGNKTGKWLMRYSDIQGLTPAQIQNKFALQYTPTHFCYVNVPSGTQMYTGIAAPIADWGVNGGGLQFELGQLIPSSSYSAGIPLP